MAIGRTLLNVTLTLGEIGVLKNIRHLIAGPPFHRVVKPKKEDADLEMMQPVIDRLRAMWPELGEGYFSEHSMPASLLAREIGISLSHEEADIYIEWLRASLEECKLSGDFYELELFVAPKKDVESCLKKLEAAANARPV